MSLIKELLSLRESSQPEVMSVQDALDEIQGNGKNSHGDGIYLCKAEPHIASRVDEIETGDEAKDAQIAKDLLAGKIHVFTTYTTGGNDEGAWVFGDVEEITPPSFDTYAFREDSDLDSDADPDDYEDYDDYLAAARDEVPMVKQLKKSHGEAVANAVRDMIQQDMTIQSHQVAPGQWVLVVATDD